MPPPEARVNPATLKLLHQLERIVERDVKARVPAFPGNLSFQV